jgi:D-alanine-D-alanine ligase
MRIVVLFGGTSRERDVSIASAAQIIPALRGLGHTVFAVDAASGRLNQEEERTLFTRAVSAEPPATAAIEALRERSAYLAPSAADLRDADVVFVALHGGAGEDGRMQAVLDLAGIAYTGSNHIASAAAMDKDLSKRLFRSAGVPTPDWLMAPVTADQVADALGWPVIVKPDREGSTVGLSIVHEPAQLDTAIERAREFDREVMIERFIPGREFTVGILEGQALPVGEIMAPGEVFDYSSKYQEGGAREVFPADIPQKLAASMQKHALLAHNVLKLGTYSRVDFRIDHASHPWCLEINSLPGMTATSLLPQAARAAGIDFPQLVERICKGAVRPH